MRIFQVITLYWLGAGFTSAQPPMLFEHRVFKDGLVQVPLYRDQPNSSAMIDLAYRIYDPDNENKPYLFMAGGGPSLDSIPHYELMTGSTEELASYSKYFRVVLFDQRGTGGLSTRLARDLDSFSQMDPLQIIQNFSTRTHARDLASLIEKIARPGDPFYVGGHSYGGEVIFQYLSRAQIERRPQGILFLSCEAPFVSTQESFNMRMLLQIENNERWLKQNQPVRNQLQKARQKLHRLWLESDDWNAPSERMLGRYFYLVHDKELTRLQEVLEQVLSSDVKTLQDADILVNDGGFDFNDPFAYLLDWRSRENTTLQTLMDRVPFEIKSRLKPWMLLERDAFLTSQNLRRFSPERRKLIQKIDQALSEYSELPDWKQVTKRISMIPTIAVLGDQDPFIPFTSSKKIFNQLLQQPFHHLELLKEGNHWASLDESVAARVAKTFKRLEKNRPAMSCARQLSLF